MANSRAGAEKVLGEPGTYGQKVSEYAGNNEDLSKGQGGAKGQLEAGPTGTKTGTI